MTGWTSTLQAVSSGQTFVDLYEAVDGKLTDEVLDTFAIQLQMSTPAARNSFLEAVAERIAHPIERANLVTRLNTPGGGGTVPMQVRVRRNVLSQIDTRADLEGVTRSDIVREGLEIALSRYKIRGGIRNPLFHLRWTDRPGSSTGSWQQIHGTPSEILSQRAELRAKLGDAIVIEEMLFMERRPVVQWTVIGTDGKTDETRWQRVRPSTIDEVLIDAATEPGITVCCA